MEIVQGVSFLKQILLLTIADILTYFNGIQVSSIGPSWPSCLYVGVYEEVRMMKEACGEAHLKTILATGELGNLVNIHKASMVCMMAGKSPTLVYWYTF